MEETAYLFLKHGGSGEIEEKKSRFIATIRPVTTEEEAVSFIEEMKKKYWDARHNCHAYVLGATGQIMRYSDDGEPGGTAGKPMLEVLLGSGVRNIAVVVTRYFGGTLLGVGGLVRAYTEGAKIALAAAEIKTMAQSADIRLCCGYDFFGKLEYYLNEHGILVLSTEFGEGVSTVLRLREEAVLKFERDITELSAGKLMPEVISEGWSEM